MILQIRKPNNKKTPGMLKNCTGSTGVALSNNTPLFPTDVAWTDFTSDSDFTNRGENAYVDLIRKRFPANSPIL